MSEWIYFIHPPRGNDDRREDGGLGVPFERFGHLLAEGTIILVGQTLGWDQHGIAIFEGPRGGVHPASRGRDPVPMGG